MEAGNKATRKRNPQAKANFFSKLFFFYMLPIFYRNYKQGFEEKDLFQALRSHKAQLLGDKLEEVWQEQNKKHKKWALHRALFQIFGLELAIGGILRLCCSLLAVSLMPLSLSSLLLYFDDTSETSKNEAYMYASLIITAIVLNVFLTNHLSMQMMHLCMKLRISCCSLVYRKSIKLSQSALAETSIGQIINLLSNDVGKFDQGFSVCHYIWVAPIQCIVGTYLMYRIVGVAAFSGTGFLLLFVPLQFYFGNRTAVLRLRTALRTDERVRLMNEFLGGIQVIKMYSWEKPFSKLISLARRYEIKAVRASLFLGTIKFALEMILTRIAVFITIIVLLSLGNGITANVVYPMIAIYEVFRMTITYLFAFSIESISEVHISLSRIQTFLNNNEVSQLPTNTKKPIDGNAQLIKDQNIKSQKKFKPPKICLANVDAQWSPDLSDKTLTNINISIQDSKLVAVIGKVGSGKSSLLSVILKELPISKGSTEVGGKFSYASQESWLFSASVRQNILFGEPYIEDRYQTVVKVCALEADLAMLPYGDRTIVGEKGKKLSGGQKARVNLARCVYKQADIYLLDDPLSAVDTKVGKQLYEDCISKFLSGKIRILATHQLQYLKEADEIIILEEGKIAGQGTYRYLKKSGLDFAKVLCEFTTDSEQETNNTDTDCEKNIQLMETTPENENSPEDSSETVGRGHIPASVYAAYFRAGGKYVAMGLLVLAIAGLQGAGNAGDYYISQWVNIEQKVTAIYAANNSSGADVIGRDEITYWYSAIILVLIGFAALQTIFFFVFSTRAAVNLHASSFSKISYATMRFFNANPVGRILNRFSMDIGIIDEYLPYLVYDNFQVSLLFLGTAVLTSIINPWLLLPAAGLSLLFYSLRNIYIETSRSLKRIEGITRSPIYTHITASVQGLSTIRASLAQQTLTREFDDILDVQSSASFLSICSNKAFIFWVDLISMLIISIVTLSLVFLGQNYLDGEAGLILTQYLSMSSLLQFGVRVFCELENHMTSAERVLEYTKVETEPIRNQPPTLPKNWPEFGRVIFENVSMRYNPKEAPVLNRLSFTIQPLEKVGIVGRTGAGKSSIIAALFQLYDIEGTITIDGIDIKTVPLEDLRSKVSIIPQDPVLFCATVRRNLDPFDEYDNEQIWKGLEQVELKQIIADIPCGLSSNITEGGTNFSTGQRQLLCLARAILRNNKILVMDEATANVDPYTDALIQKTIRKNFANCTVITVAHRLHTVLDSDRILVMDTGEVVEFDHPYNLLQRTDGMFYNMVRMLGQTAAKNLQNSPE